MAAATGGRVQALVGLAGLRRPGAARGCRRAPTCRRAVTRTSARAPRTEQRAQRGEDELGELAVEVPRLPLARGSARGSWTRSIAKISSIALASAVVDDLDVDLVVAAAG